MHPTAAYPVRVQARLDTGLSRWLWLVKWLLAIPHRGPGLPGPAPGALIPSGSPVGSRIYEFVIGMNLWALRVVAYAALMTDAYPPFRLDLGGTDPVGPTPAPPPQDIQAGRQAGDVPATSPVPPARN